MTSFATAGSTHYSQTHQGEDDTTTLKSVKELGLMLEKVVTASHFLALTVRPRQWWQAQERLCRDYPFKRISFDELLLRHVQAVCATMPKAPDWQVVLKADDTERSSRDWQNLQRLVQRALPAMAEEILQTGQPVLLTEPGLLARYELITTWLNDLRQQLMNVSSRSGIAVPGLALLIAVDAQRSAAMIDGALVPTGAGSKECAHIPSSWLESDQLLPEAVESTA